MGHHCCVSFESTKQSHEIVSYINTPLIPSEELVLDAVSPMVENSKVPSHPLTQLFLEPQQRGLEKAGKP